MPRPRKAEAKAMEVKTSLPPLEAIVPDDAVRMAEAVLTKWGATGGHSRASMPPCNAGALLRRPLQIPDVCGSSPHGPNPPCGSHEIGGAFVSAAARIVPMPPAITPAARHTPGPLIVSNVAHVLSPSQVTEYLDCSARWYYHHALGLPDKRTAALAIGEALHAVTAAALRIKAPQPGRRIGPGRAASPRTHGRRPAALRTGYGGEPGRAWPNLPSGCCAFGGSRSIRSSRPPAWSSG